ncbi:MAG: hypothetical protein ACOY90_22795 [Candidatus Zhuqueibacterota bacterium]
MKNSRLPMAWLLLAVWLVFGVCKNDADVGRSVASHAVQPADSTQQIPAEFDRSGDAILRQLREKEAELIAKKEELDKMASELSARQDELTQIQAELKNYRNVSYIIFLIGILLILSGLIASTRRRKSASPESAPPEQ